MGDNDGYSYPPHFRLTWMPRYDRCTRLHVRLHGLLLNTCWAGACDVCSTAFVELDLLAAHQTTNFDALLVLFWPTVCDVGPVLNQHQSLARLPSVCLLLRTFSLSTFETRFIFYIKLWFTHDLLTEVISARFH